MGIFSKVVEFEDLKRKKIKNNVTTKKRLNLFFFDFFLFTICGFITSNYLYAYTEGQETSRDAYALRNPIKSFYVLI